MLNITSEKFCSLVVFQVVDNLFDILGLILAADQDGVRGFDDDDVFDVKGGEMLKLIHKYYLTDFGFKCYILSNPDIEVQQLLENTVYLELLRRRYKVATGKVADKEVDFVVKGTDGIIRYIQVAVTIATREKFQQETAAFTAIADNYPRYVLTLDDVFVPDRSGIQVINAIDFLAGRTDLTR